MILLTDMSIKRPLLFIIAVSALSSLPAMGQATMREYLSEDGVLVITNVQVNNRFREASAHGAGLITSRLPGLTREKYKQSLEHSAHTHAIDPALLQAIISVESNGRANAISRKGAMGLMQVLPETGRRYGIENLLDPAQNIEAGTRYLRALAAMFNNDLALVLAAYNAGERAVERFGNRIPPYRETQQYVSRVTERYQFLKAQVQ